MARLLPRLAIFCLVVTWTASGCIVIRLPVDDDDSWEGHLPDDDAADDDTGDDDSGDDDAADDDTGDDDTGDDDTSDDDSSGTPAGDDDTSDPCVAPGFCGTAEGWPLPPGYPDDFWDEPDGSYGCLTDDHVGITLDLDGDWRPELVLTDDCSDPAVGTDRWDVHLNTGAGFEAAATSWALPPGFPVDFWDAPDGSYGCLDDDHVGSTLDLDGDWRPDLVHTDDCDDPAVGTDRWDVYLNTGSGFAAAPLAWPLPAGFPGDFWDSPDGSYGCLFDDDVGFTFDVDGDWRPDLVHTDDCDDPAVGTDRWDVYLNTGAGFAAAPLAWPLPTGFPADFWDAPDGSHGCLFDDHVGFTFDIDGDHRPDLVHTDDCDDPSVGTDRWDVYLNTGAGFAAAPLTWPLPPGLPADFFDAPDGLDACYLQDHVGATLDVDGDWRPDLVVTDGCDAAGAGTTRWDVYLNTGAGFAPAPLSWSLPAAAPAEFWDALDGQDACYIHDHVGSTLDLDGDQMPDLVVTDGCDAAGVGTGEWIVYRNLGS